MGTVSFPGLGLEFHLNRVAFHIGSWPVYWYGIIIAAGFLLAVLYCCHAAKRFGIKQDDIIDMLFFARAPVHRRGAAVLHPLLPGPLPPGGRFPGLWSHGPHLGRGLAIYGGVIMAVVVRWCSARCGRSDFWPLQTWGCSVCSSAR